MSVELRQYMLVYILSNCAYIVTLINAIFRKVRNVDPGNTASACSMLAVVSLVRELSRALTGV